nr:VP3 [Bat RVJ-like rotavirus BtSY3]
MAKVIIRTDSDGTVLTNEEDIFRISNNLSTEIKVQCTDEIFQKIKRQTFYITFDLTNNIDHDAFKLYSDIFPTPIFKESEENFKFGSCRHVLSNIIHYDNALFIHYENIINNLLPRGWAVKYIKDSDYPIGNDLIPNYFDAVYNSTVYKFINDANRLDDELKITKIDEKIKVQLFSEALSYIYQPATEYDSNSYNYRVSRREIGKLVRKLSFNIVGDNIHLVGPETESIRDVVLFLNNLGKTITFYTIDTSRNTTYILESEKLKKTKMTWRNLLYPQYKNMNNFVKGLIYHLNDKNVAVDKVYYIGSYPSYWLESLDWINFNVICYDPKHRIVQNDRVIWKQQFFTLDDVKNIPEKSYVYIDIRSDSRDDASREKILKDEDDMIQKMCLMLLDRKCTVLAKRKVFQGRNVVIGEACFPPSINQLGREYYNLVSERNTDRKYVDHEYLYKKILSARYNNVSNYIYGGSKFDIDKYIDNGIILALYSLSNSINSKKLLEFVISKRHLVTFPTNYEKGDWREPKQQGKEPFPGKVKQSQFEDWYVDPKAFAIKYRTEIMSESVFLQYSNDRAFIPDLYNHMVSTNIADKLLFSDMFFSHIGIRQPSIYLRDKYMTSRLSAYISRKLTHSIHLSDLLNNKFEGYSGHLIAIESSFNSLVYTMSPFRWIIRAVTQLHKGKRRDKFKIGDGQPHTKEEYINTYQYLDENDIVQHTFEKMITADELSI